MSTRPSAGKDLGAIGRAKRFGCTLETGSLAELWCFDASDAALVRRLVAFGESGVGGFSRSWTEDAGVFVLRRLPSRTVESLAKGERLDGLTTLAKMRDVARALAACEAKAVFPGPLRPAEVALGSPGRAEAFVLAEGWVRALVGGGAAGASGASGSVPSAPSPRWTPPEQVRGAPWDNAANRYVLGLVMYRLLAGAHPFSGIGLRDAMAAAESAPPPFDEETARTLKPGIQSFVLAMLDPDPARRPPSAEAIAVRCEELMRDAPVARTAEPALVPEPARIHPARARVVVDEFANARAAPSRSRLAFTLAPILFGVALAGAGLAASSTRPDPVPPSEKRSLSQAPLQKTTAEACAPCHVRQVAEWSRSVMAHSVKSPLFGALESVVEEQVGRDDRCPGGAGVLRRASGDVCRDEKTGLTVTGTGGEHWCVNCHSAADNLKSTVPAWSASAGSAAQRPLRDVLGAQAMEGISCAVCHQTIGPVHETAAYQGNPTWVSPATGAVFRMRPEDGLGVRGIGNSGYLLDSKTFLVSSLGKGGAGDPIVHRRTPEDAARYLRSSEFCGACHDVRLFGTDSIGVRDRGEHFKRLRNAYSEWKAWSDAERSAGRRAATCQDCHMSLYPGVCVKDSGKDSGRTQRREGCAPGTHFEARAPGEKARGMIASSSTEPQPLSSHWFTSVDLPLATEFPDAWANETALDPSGVPVGLEPRRDQLLRHTFRFAIASPLRVGSRIEIPLEIQNVGAGHRVPAGFSQEREIWVELVVRDGRGDVVYEVGKIATDDADLRDKIFVRTTTRDDVKDLRGKPQGVFGADLVDGPDVPQWSPNPAFGGTTFRGRGLVNMQNGFLRCVRCIGFIDAEGRCQAGPGQGRTRADRFDDGVYDIDTGECRSNLSGTNAFFETYFPVGALDADRGIAKAPDAILDQRSAAPGVVLRYTYEIDAPGRTGPFTAQARLRFRPFPPFLLRAFADYEARKASQGLRPSG
ncbi:MAG: Serine/threonine-protein kinase PknA, partial [Labilithrix sp.]|nr:Serine/threonine-protein kinase PknA [Labilithrix sp.]